MNKEEMKRILDVASGKTPADIVFKKATIVDVFNKELYVSDLYIKMVLLLVLEEMITLHLLIASIVKGLILSQVSSMLMST